LQVQEGGFTTFKILPSFLPPRGSRLGLQVPSVVRLPFRRATSPAMKAARCSPYMPLIPANCQCSVRPVGPQEQLLQLAWANDRLQAPQERSFFRCPAFPRCMGWLWSFTSSPSAPHLRLRTWGTTP
jgi:hypothetical protein